MRGRCGSDKALGGRTVHLKESHYVGGFWTYPKENWYGLEAGRGSRDVERWNQEDVMNNVRVKNPEKKVSLRCLPQETRCQGHRGTDHLWSRVSIIIKFLKTYWV